jgi:hypothetical protein
MCRRINIVAIGNRCLPRLCIFLFCLMQALGATLVSIRRVQGKRAIGMNPIDENDVAPEDKDDFDDLPTMGDIPADKDVEEGDEEDDGFDLPPAMPPAV